jgi:hypothetical protein
MMVAKSIKIRLLNGDIATGFDDHGGGYVLNKCVSRQTDRVDGKNYIFW